MNLDDFFEILFEYQSDILCLQEVQLSFRGDNFLKQYTVFRKDRTNNTHSSGGVPIVA